jgi:hypothetical protein
VNSSRCINGEASTKLFPGCHGRFWRFNKPKSNLSARPTQLIVLFERFPLLALYFLGSCTHEIFICKILVAGSVKLYFFYSLVFVMLKNLCLQFFDKLKIPGIKNSEKLLRALKYIEKVHCVNIKL